MNEIKPLVNNPNINKLKTPTLAIILLSSGIVCFSLFFFLLMHSCKGDDFICGIGLFIKGIVIILPASLVLLIWGLIELHKFFKK